MQFPLEMMLTGEGVFLYPFKIEYQDPLIKQIGISLDRNYNGLFETFNRVEQRNINFLFIDNACLQ